MPTPYPSPSEWLAAGDGSARRRQSPLGRRRPEASRGGGGSLETRDEGKTVLGGGAMNPVHGKNSIWVTGLGAACQWNACPQAYDEPRKPATAEAS